ncbi:MAG TPA: glucose 1-dehydrogenase [Acidimicrobiales bacterium]|nr:glucose 1-dehydrogenase [Acidimicrobiales bacterium]
MSVSFDLTDRVALVTGGSRGLGREMVLGFARAGADVVIASRKADACEALAKEVEAETGRAALPYACHVGHWDEIDGLVDAAYDRFGKVDVLVNNAGMSPLYDDLSAVTEDLYDKVFDVNLKGPFRLTALAGKRMVEAGRGSIIFVSSTGSLRPYPGIVPYAAAKAGVNAMTVGFARAYGPTVRVNCIIPGAFATDVTNWWDDATKAAAAANPPLKRIGDPSEIVGTALYLASDASSYTTGTHIVVDGGSAA